MKDFIIGFSGGVLFMIGTIYHFAPVGNELFIIKGSALGVFCYLASVMIISSIPEETKNRFYDKLKNG